MPWRCFVVTPSKFFERSLRRYSKAKCAEPPGYHDFTIKIETMKEGLQEGGSLKEGWETDPRWPKCCPCNYRFLDSDEWQVKVDRLYEGFPDGKLYTLPDPELPIGAMWRAQWFEDGWKGPDGCCWVVRMPGKSDFVIDGPSKDGGFWQRSGTAPNLTCSPSINLVGTYHGYLQNGIISEDCEQRKFAGVPRTA